MFKSVYSGAIRSVGALALLLASVMCLASTPPGVPADPKGFMFGEGTSATIGLTLTANDANVYKFDRQDLRDSEDERFKRDVIHLDEVASNGSLGHFLYLGGHKIWIHGSNSSKPEQTVIPQGTYKLGPLAESDLIYERSRQSDKTYRMDFLPVVILSTPHFLLNS